MEVFDALQGDLTASHRFVLAELMHHKSVRVRKGNIYVRRLLCEYAHAASRTTSVFKSKFPSLVVRRGYKRAIAAIGHKILRTIFFILKMFGEMHQIHVGFDKIVFSLK